MHKLGQSFGRSNMWAAFEFDNVMSRSWHESLSFMWWVSKNSFCLFKWMMDEYRGCLSIEWIMMDEYHVCLSIEWIMMDQNLGLLDQNTSFEGWVFSIEKKVQILLYLFIFPFHECRKMWWYVPFEFDNILWWMHSDFFWLLNEWMNEWLGKTRIHWDAKIYITWRLTLFTNTHFDGFESKKIWWCQIYILGTFNSDVLKDMFGLCDPTPIGTMWWLGRLWINHIWVTKGPPW